MGLMILILIFVVILVMVFVGVYNSLVALKTQVDRAWANIDVILKQRFDEIPQLIEVIEQYVQYERDVLDQLIEARTRYVGARSTGEKIEASQAMSLAMGGLLALGENYPDLKANQNFIQLQSRVSQLENAIADRRETYNEYVANFNARIVQIPQVFFAGMLGYQPAALFQASETERARPSLKMDLHLRGPGARKTN